MSSYDNVFGGQNINPAMLSYAAYSIAANLTLVWPFEAVDGDDVVAAKIDVTATAGSLSVTMPDATQVSDGQDVLITNRGATTFTVKGSGGATLATVTSGTSWYIYLTSNATSAGTWYATQLGAATSSANAAALAGSGLVADGTQLDQQLLVNPESGAYAVLAADLATVLKFTGGAETWTFPSAVTVGNGWFVTVINAGTGVLTLDPSGAQTIDGESTKELNPDESVQVFSDGTNLVTFGFGRSVTTGVSAVAIDLVGSGTYTESVAELASQIQDFSGVLSGARTVYFGTEPGFWLVYNGTSGSYSTTFAVNAGDPGVVVEQGTYRVLRSNGSNVTLSSPNSGTQTFTASGTFTWPTCKGATVRLTGTGGGGGRGADATNPGCGGGGGGVREILISPPPSAGTTTTVTINAAGVGATATNTAGTAGGIVSFGSFGTVRGGAGGNPTSTGSRAGGAANNNAFTVTDADAFDDAGVNSTTSGTYSSGWGGGMGGSASAAAGAGGGGGSAANGAPGGGGGGGTGPAAGGAGGKSGGRDSGGGGAGGTAGGATGGAGTAGTAGTNGLPGTGGGGGGGGTNTGGVGGAGGAPGGGGGGGGYGGVTSGNGGNGARGEVTVTWW